MTLPIDQPLAPQLARSAAQLPVGEGWSYEPKWDGFRAIAFVDGDERLIQSRAGKPLDRYFPELKFPPGRYVLDGEIVIAGEGGRQDFDALSQRIHPAASRIERLSVEAPACFVAFDLLADGDEPLLRLPFSQRRALLERLELGAVELTSMTTDEQVAREWLQSLEGVVAKQLEAPYRPGERAGMVKVKRVRTIDCVVVGWRPGKEERTVGSLILGLFDEQGTLVEVGHTSSFRAAERRELVDRLAPYETGNRGSAEPSRWRSDKDLEWIELRPELVVEVSFDHTSNGRIRHGAKLQRWRTDKRAEECTIDQLK